MRDRLTAILTATIDRAIEAGAIQTRPDQIEVQTPKQEGHGDLATNLAMVMAKPERRSPRDIAADLIAHLDDQDGYIDRVEVAGPGFLNFFMADSVWQAVVDDILTAGPAYGRSQAGAGTRVQVEFVSANPTGPLHVGHGRGAAVGDCLARLLEATGYQVSREYYINDAGRQMLILGRSVWARYRQQLGLDIEFPDNGYRGEYIADIAKIMIDRHGDGLADLEPEAAAARVFPEAAELILSGIRDDLALFGVEYDNWFSEKTLHDSGRIDEILSDLKTRGTAYEKDGAWWYKTEERGDEKDRVLVKANGDLTYFAADVAYHADKFARGFDWVIDLWGADHHGYIPRMKAMVEGLGYDRDQLTLKLVQLVNLLRAGEPVAMSTRAGEFVTLKDVVDEVGRDACRFIFLTRRADSHLDFDLETAKQKSMDNPVYYVQYAHARVASIGRKAAQQGLDFPGPGQADWSRLTEDEELKLLRALADFPNLVAGAAAALEPHRVTYYLTELASRFHTYYNRHRVLVDDPKLTEARLALAAAVRQVVANGLNLLGVEAPDRMDRDEDEPTQQGA